MNSDNPNHLEQQCGPVPLFFAVALSEEVNPLLAQQKFLVAL